MHGTVELRTERLLLRKYCAGDAIGLYQDFGTDEVMYEYSGWNPYATPEMARETVRRYIEGYCDVGFYGWAVCLGDALVGTIGAYDRVDEHIEVGFSIARAFWGRGYATEALRAVLEYLTGSEGIPCVTAWCAAENVGSGKALEKAGMKLVKKDCGGLAVGDRVFDKLIYEYRREK